MTAPVLFVDDDPHILEAHQRTFRRRFQLDTAPHGEAALALIQSKGPYAVIVADMRMPRMNGVEFLVEARKRCPDTVRIMLTGNADQHTAVEAGNRGHVYQFLCKPCPPEMLGLAVENGLRQYALVTAERDLLEKTLAGSVQALTEILALQDPPAFQLGQRLRDRIHTLAETVQDQARWELELGAMLAPIGFVTVPASVIQRLRSGHALTAEEQSMVDRVPEIGAGLLARIPRLDGVARIILYQNKNFDGSGFPQDSIAGHAIPFGARLLHLFIDLIDLERKSFPQPEALRQLEAKPGRHDPDLIRLLASTAGSPGQVPASAIDGLNHSSTPTPTMIRDLRVGAVLAQDVETSEGMLIVPQGTKLSPILLEKLRNFARSTGLREPVFVEG